MYRNLMRTILACAGLVVVAGCRSDSFVLAPVSGRVTVDGQPVAGLRVAFEPMGSAERRAPGPEAVGVTDEDGRFTLETMAESPRTGAVVGKCRVRIWALPSDQKDRVDRDKVTDVMAPGFDPVKEVNDLKEQLRRQGRKKAASKPTGAIPLRYNDNTELSFDVPPGGTDKADFSLSSK